MKAKSWLMVNGFAFLVLNMILAVTMPLWAPTCLLELEGVQHGILKLPIDIELTLRIAFGGACAFLVSGLVIGLFTNSTREAIIGCISFSAMIGVIGFMGFVLYEALSERVFGVGLFVLVHFGFIACVSTLSCTLGGILGNKFRERLKAKLHGG